MTLGDHDNEGNTNNSNNKQQWYKATMTMKEAWTLTTTNNGVRQS